MSYNKKSRHNLDFYILVFYTLSMMPPPAPPPPSPDPPGRVWLKTKYANLMRYVPSETYYARFRCGGKLVWKSLDTTRISIAELRLTAARGRRICRVRQ